MAQITDVRRLILHCTEVNANYMRLPAGMLQEYQAVAEIYQRVAEQSRQCALAWIRHGKCPQHEPAVDGFWHGVVAWSEAFGLSIGADPVEWLPKFVDPHQEFAQYIRREKPMDGMPTVRGSPCHVIMTLDALWMRRVIDLTARWGFFHYALELPSLMEAKRLEADLQDPGSGARRAYLQSDLVFFRELFKPFPFSDEMRDHLDNWLLAVEEEINGE